MSRLRITQSTIDRDRYRIDLEFEVEGAQRQTATVNFDFRMTEQDQADLRWYLEDFLQYPQDPAPTVAARIERRMAEIGTELFQSVFHASDDARDLWATLRAKLDDTRVEVITSVEGAAAIPWELIHDPKTNTPLALRASVFIRAHPQPAQRPELPKTKSGLIRTLLVICRPRANDDVPFRSVASRLIKGLSEAAQATYQLDVLRPPTYAQLATVLRRAKAVGKPYHVVHFDGHGMYAELASAGDAAQILQHLFPVVFSTPRQGKHGFLVFENPTHSDNVELIDGPTLGRLLVETDVPVLVLNACRSAHAEAPIEPEQAQIDAAANPHAQVRAFGSLAQEVMDAGVAGVVAMRYNVYVVTAAQFVADLYAELVRGQTLGAAVTTGRKQLYDNPDRTIAYDPRPLRDWCVPVVYEAAPIQLFPKRKADGPTITIQAGDTVSSRGSLDKDLPRPPDAGFFGRDETLLALDRAFDTQSIVLMHAFAGSGKTSTAAEFARWYALTGGVAGPVLFSSFEQYRPLSRVLDRIGEVFGGALKQAGVHWQALDDAKRRDEALNVLKQIPVLWFWDNLEPVAGFPKGTPSAWSAAEQRELADFLRDARATKAKFLLTSRRDEQDWLDALPSRIQIGPMPMQERVQLARALAEKYGRRITDVQDWRPLLRFTEGNPLTITVLVSQALRDRLTRKEQVEDFVAKLRVGEAKFDDEASEGRTKALGASLSYGFTHTFTENERRQLALLHLFQGFVNVDVLSRMGRPNTEWCLPAVCGLTPENGNALLDRAAEIGLLTRLDVGYYSIHPAVPWFFKGQFETFHAEPIAEAVHGSDHVTRTRPVSATRAFVIAMGEQGNLYQRQFDSFDSGNHEVIFVLSAEEANLLSSRRLALQNGWWRDVLSAMGGLSCLYNQTGRRAEWTSLVEEITPIFLNPDTNTPRPNIEDYEHWFIFNGYLTILALEQRDWAEADRLVRESVNWSRRRAEEIVDQYLEGADLSDLACNAAQGGGNIESLATSELPSFLDRLKAVTTHLSFNDRNSIRSLGASLQQFGVIQARCEKPECVASYEEAIALYTCLDDRGKVGLVANSLGLAYRNIPAIRDLDRAESWFRRSLELTNKHDQLGQQRALDALGALALARFREARDAGKPNEFLQRHLKSAREFYVEALNLLPESAVNSLADNHNQLGIIYRYEGNIDRALMHYQKSIYYEELQGNGYGAATTRLNIALALVRSERFSDARAYAVSARGGFFGYGDRAASEVRKAEVLIAYINQEIIARKSP